MSSKAEDKHPWCYECKKPKCQCDWQTDNKEGMPEWTKQNEKR